MSIRTGLLMALWFAGIAAAAVAAPPTATPPAPQKKAAADSTAHKRPAVKASKSESGTKGVRTIDAINIEGEIAVPQVLFITSRDNRRYRDGLGKTFRMGTLDVARSLTMPNRLCVAGSPGPKSLKEE